MCASPVSDRPGRALSLEPFLERVRIRNYKSIGKCDARLGRLSVLVGRNGSGKSNFLDALRFVADALQTTLDHALKARGGINEVRRRSTGHPRNFAIRLSANQPDGQVATYGFEIGVRKARGGSGSSVFFVKHEELELLNASGMQSAKFRVEDGNVKNWLCNGNPPPPAASDRLYLVNAAGLPEFRGIYDSLLAMGFYNLNPQEMKELQSPDAGELLHRNGSNIASVLARIQAEQPDVVRRIQSYLSTIVPDVHDVTRVPLGPRETLEFRQKVVGAEHPWRFYAASMSDGTLRALGILVAVAQRAANGEPVRLVGIEEPESELHPAAAGALMDCLHEAAVHTQILVTSHSPDLLDQMERAPDELLVVESVAGETHIAPIGPASRQAINEHLYSPGELLRMDQLKPDPIEIQRQQQLDLFAIDEDSR